MTRNPIAILTDSTCDIPDNLIAQYGIIVIPQYIIWGDQQYRDRVDLQPLEFYQRLANDPQRPTTAVASVADFQQAIQVAISQGAKEAIILTVSGAMSGVFQTAQSAAKSAPIPVSVVDSKGASMALGWQVLAAARARDAGYKMSEILSDVDRVGNKMEFFVTLETLEYLQRGGRIGDAVKWVSNLLHVKPLIYFSHQTGRIEPIGVVRTHKALVELMVRKFSEKLQGGKNFHIAVLHGNAEEDANLLAGRIKAEFNPTELVVRMTGPILGIHSGPGALALCGYAED